MPVYLGLAVLLAAASLVAVNSRGGTASRLPRPFVPRDGSSCSSPPNGAFFSGSADGVQMTVCISQEGNINQIQYPDTAPGHTQIAFDGYCLRTGFGDYWDYSPGSGVASSGWGPATLTQAASNIWSMTRDTSDGKFRLTEFIKINVQPRSVFVGMRVTNIDPANVTHGVLLYREVAPAIDGNAADDQYNEFGRDARGFGATGQAFEAPNPTVGTNSLLFGATRSGASVFTGTVADFQAAGGCGRYNQDHAGFVTGGNRVFLGAAGTFSLAAGETANVGKFVYRML